MASEGDGHPMTAMGGGGGGSTAPFVSPAGVGDSVPRWRVFKNVAVVSLAFLLLFTAFQSVQNLQSSINSVQGLGLASLSVIYGSLVLSCMFVPSVLIARLGCKWTLVASVICYMVYMLANLQASWYTLMPASALLGASAAPLWAAKCAYLNRLAEIYSGISGVRLDAVISRFFGLFFMTFQSGQVWGNLISSEVLGAGIGKENQTVFETDDYILARCGPNFCPSVSADNGTDPNDNLARPSMSKIYTLFGIYSACALLSALLVAALLDPLPTIQETKSDKTERKESRKFSAGLLIATLKLWKHPKLLFLVPLTIYSGMEQAYIAGDFTKAYVSCSWGIHMVGYVMITFGVCDSLCSVLSGRLSQHFGRIPFFAMAAVLNAGTMAAMLLWSPHVSQAAVFFVLAGLWGLADGVWQTQINAFYGVLFTKDVEAAFSNYRLWESLGFIIAFVWGDYVCVNVKIYALLAVLVTGITGYAICEHRYAKGGKAATADAN